MSEGARQKLARQRRMRLLDPSSNDLKRVALSTLLPVGARLLIPKESPPEHEEQESGDASAVNVPGSNTGCVPKHVQRLEAKLAEHLQRRILHSDAELLVLNKPAGLPVQGGDRIHVSVDSLLPHLRFGSAENPRLVHRLDRNTSGALVVARTADAAAWLSRAFRLPAQSLQQEAAGQLPPARGVPSVEKHYQAVVEDGPGLQDSGFISAQLPAQGGRDAGQRAVTNYEVLARSAEGFAWLALQPVTGRKHQLRQHCAEMGAPVVGDGRYGCTRSPKQQRLRQLLQDTLAPEQDADEAELDRLLRCDSHLLLHCSRIVIQRSANHRADVVAPPSQHMQRVLDVLFHSGSGAATGSRREGDMSSPLHARTFSSVPLLRMPHSRPFSVDGCSASVGTVGCLLPPLRLLVEDDSTAPKACPGAAMHTRTSAEAKESSEVSQGSCLKSPATSPSVSNADTTAVQLQLPEQSEWDPEEKKRWSWARKRAARIEREKGADVKRQKKKRKVARKNRRGRQRSARRRLGEMRPVVVLDVR